MQIYDLLILLIIAGFCFVFIKTSNVLERLFIITFVFYSLVPAFSLVNFLRVSESIREIHTEVVLTASTFILFAVLATRIFFSSSNIYIQAAEKPSEKDFATYYPVVPIFILPIAFIPVAAGCSKSALLGLLPNHLTIYFGAVSSLILLDYLKTRRFKFNLSCVIIVYFALVLCGGRIFAAPLLLTLISFYLLFGLKRAGVQGLFLLLGLTLLSVGYALYRVGQLSSVEDVLTNVLRTGFGEFFMTRHALDYAPTGGSLTQYLTEVGIRLIPFGVQLFEVVNIDTLTNETTGLDFGLAGNFFADLYYFSETKFQYFFSATVVSVCLYLSLRSLSKWRTTYIFGFGLLGLMPNVFRSGSLVLFSYIKVYLFMLCFLVVAYLSARFICSNLRGVTRPKILASPADRAEKILT